MKRTSLASLVLILLAGCACRPPPVPPPAILSQEVRVNELMLVPCVLPEITSLSTERDVANHVSDLLAAFVECSNKHTAVSNVLRFTLNQPTKAP